MYCNDANLARNLRMGGFGSGRRLQSKNTTNDYRQFDVRRLQMDGFLKPGRTFGWQWKSGNKTMATINVHTEINKITLSYKHKSYGKEWKDVSYPVWLDWTYCNYGNWRAWLLCPGKGCGRRVAILYGGAIFACRYCHKLAYPCQRETALDRVARRANRIRRRLGWKEDIINPNGDKPKGMHWQTFWKLERQHNKFHGALLYGMKQQLGLRN